MRVLEFYQNALLQVERVLVVDFRVQILELVRFLEFHINKDRGELNFAHLQPLRQHPKGHVVRERLPLAAQNHLLNGEVYS